MPSSASKSNDPASVCRAVINDTVCADVRLRGFRVGHETTGRPTSEQTVHVVGVGVGASLPRGYRATYPAKKLPFVDVRRATSGNQYRRRRDQVPAKAFDLFRIFRGYTCRGHNAARRPLERCDSTRSCPVRDRHHDDRRLQPIGGRARRRQSRNILRRRRNQKHVPRVAVRRIHRRQEVRLLVRVGMPVDGFRALNVDQNGRNFGKVRKAEELAHQRQPGPLVAVNERAPFHAAPMTIPMAASSLLA